jgi:rubredoxin
MECLTETGEVNSLAPISLPDVIHLVNYVFDKDRPATGCLSTSPGNCWSFIPSCRGEVNGIPPISLPDVIHLVNYVFDKDRPATACLGTDPGNCWTPVPTGVCCLP